MFGESTCTGPGFRYGHWRELFGDRTGPGSFFKGLMGDRTGPGSFLKGLMGDRTGPGLILSGFLGDRIGPDRSLFEICFPFSKKIGTIVPIFFSLNLCKTVEREGKGRERQRRALRKVKKCSRWKQVVFSTNHSNL